MHAPIYHGGKKIKCHYQLSVRKSFFSQRETNNNRMGCAFNGRETKKKRYGYGISHSASCMMLHASQLFFSCQKRKSRLPFCIKLISIVWDERKKKRCYCHEAPPKLRLRVFFFQLLTFVCGFIRLKIHFDTPWQQSPFGLYKVDLFRLTLETLSQTIREVLFT